MAQRIRKKINILNIKELNSILHTINKQNLNTRFYFKLSLSLLLYNKINTFFKIINNYTNYTFNLFITSDARYTIPKKELHTFIDLLYSIHNEKKINKYEKKILDLTTILFSLKLYDSIDDLILNLFPLTSNIIKKFHVSSVEYTINLNKYITLFDKENLFSFDIKTGYLKNWFLYKKGISLISFTSLVEQIYTLKKGNYILNKMNKIKYFKYPNGISFIFSTDNNIQIEKNIILQYKRLTISYKIKNNSRRSKKIIFIFINKFSPSIFYCFTKLKCNFAFLNYKNTPTFELKPSNRGIINLNTGYGISWKYFNKSNGISFYKNLYNFTKKDYYKFKLYPYEQKVITIMYTKKYLSMRKRKKYLNKTLKNAVWGETIIK